MQIQNKGEKAGYRFQFDAENLSQFRLEYQIFRAIEQKTRKELKTIIHLYFQSTFFPFSSEMNALSFRFSGRLLLDSHRPLRLSLLRR
jgi:hypothetical protein